MSRTRKRSLFLSVEEEATLAYQIEIARRGCLLADYDTLDMLHGYLTCALWCENLDGDFSIDQVTKASYKLAEDDIREFIFLVGLVPRKALIDRAVGGVSSRIRDSAMGHDLWLTRNGHGAGFWDGDWAEPYASIMTDAAKMLGERNVWTTRNHRYVYIE